MARKQGRKPGQPQPQAGGGGGGWAPLRDAIKRDVEQAISSLAFAERLHQKMDTQRRAFLDFPRVMEQLRSGALERLTAALSRLYEGGHGFDLQRFLRDLPLALGQLAAADKSKSQPPPAATPATDTTQAPEVQAPEVSPRVELRARMLSAAPDLSKATGTYRRNVATLRRAALPRRSPGPWRADREVLEEAHRAVEFVQKLYDAYAEAWADQPLQASLTETSDELDRFLAWTQLDRYVELAVLASTNAPRPPKPNQHVVAPPEATTTAAAAAPATTTTVPAPAPVEGA